MPGIVNHSLRKLPPCFEGRCRLGLCIAKAIAVWHTSIDGVEQGPTPVCQRHVDELRPHYGPVLPEARP